MSGAGCRHRLKARFQQRTSGAGLGEFGVQPAWRDHRFGLQWGQFYQQRQRSHHALVGDFLWAWVFVGDFVAHIFVRLDSGARIGSHVGGERGEDDRLGLRENDSIAPNPA